MHERMAIDYGSARIGVAVGSVMAREYDTIPNDTAALNHLARIIKEEHIHELIVGQPIRSQGEPGTIQEEIERLVSSLHKELPELIIDMTDEAYTSDQALHELKEGGLSIKEAKDRKDSYAAKLLLDQYNAEHPVTI